MDTFFIDLLIGNNEYIRDRSLDSTWKMKIRGSRIATSGNVTPSLIVSNGNILPFDNSKHPINEEDANEVGEKVCPQESLSKHHVTNECTAERHQPRPTNQL